MSVKRLVAAALLAAVALSTARAAAGEKKTVLVYSLTKGHRHKDAIDKHGRGGLRGRFAGPCGQFPVAGLEELDLLGAVFYEPGQLVSLGGDVGEVCLEL